MNETMKTSDGHHTLLTIFSDADLVSRVLNTRGLSFFDPSIEFDIFKDVNPPLTDAELDLKTYVLFVGKMAPKVSRLLEISLQFVTQEKDRAAALVSMVYRVMILNITTNPKVWSGDTLTPKPQILGWTKAMAPIISSQQDFERFREHIEKNY